MCQLRCLGRGPLWAISALACWLSGTPLAEAAQEAAASEGGGGGSPVMGYAVVLLGVALGMLLVCHSSPRSDQRKMPE